MRPTFRFELLRGQAALAQLGGDDDRAWRLLDTARGLDRDLGRRTGLYLSGTETSMLRRAGRYEELRVTLLPYLAEAGAARVVPTRPWHAAALVELEVRLGNLNAARAAAAGLEGADGYEPLTRSRMALAELHLFEGDARAGRRLRAGRGERRRRRRLAAAERGRPADAWPGARRCRRSSGGRAGSLRGRAVRGQGLRGGSGGGRVAASLIDVAPRLTGPAPAAGMLVGRWPTATRS